MTKVHCPKCDHEIEVTSELKTFTHSLSKGLVIILLKFVKNADRERQVRVKCGNGILNGNELGNYSKLVYWGFVQKTGDAGLWQVKPKAILFLKGDISVPRKVVTSNANVVKFSEELIGIKDYRGLDEEYWQKEFFAEIRNQRAPVQPVGLFDHA